MSKVKRLRAIRKYALEVATQMGHPSEARSVARSIRRRGLWKNYHQKNSMK